MKEIFQGDSGEAIYQPAGKHTNVYEVVKTSTVRDGDGGVVTIPQGARIVAWLPQELPHRKDWSWAFKAEEVFVRYRTSVESLRPGVLVALLSE